MHAFLALLSMCALVACGSGKAGDSAVPTTASESPARVQLVYEMDDASLTPATAEVLRKRVQGLQPAVEVSTEGATITLSFASASESEREMLRLLALRVGNLSLHKVITDSPFMSTLCESVRADSKAGVMRIETALDTWQGPDGQIHRDCYLSASDRTAMLTAEEARQEGCTAEVSAERSPCIISGRTILERYLAGRDDLKLDEGTEFGFEAAISTALPGDEGDRFWRTYYQESKSEVGSAQVRSATVNSSPELGAALVVELDEHGKLALAALTRSHLGDKLGISIDDVVQSVPVVYSEINGGRLMLSLPALGHSQGQSEAKALARILSSGPLPGPMQLLREE